MKLTGDRGVDTAIEAVGIPATFELCQQIVAPGGTIANIGVHGTKVDLHLESLWDRNITITTRLVDTVSTPMLLNTVRSHKIDPKLLITHRFKLDQSSMPTRPSRTPPRARMTPRTIELYQIVSHFTSRSRVAENAGLASARRQPAESGDRTSASRLRPAANNK